VPRLAVWKAFADRKTWSDWYGARLAAVRPRWEEDATLVFRADPGTPEHLSTSSGGPEAPSRAASETMLLRLKQRVKAPPNPAVSDQVADSLGGINSCWDGIGDWQA
jgi:hypothetical protein